MRDVSRLQFIRLVGKYAKGRYRELEKFITHLEGGHLEIDSEQDLVVNIDGEALWSKHVNFGHTIGKDFIFEEMQREFVGEGQLWYAYKRNNRAIQGSDGETEPSDDIFVFPFPDTEIEDGHRTQR